jgi:hypothetical protein
MSLRGDGGFCMTGYEKVANATQHQASKVFPCHSSGNGRVPLLYLIIMDDCVLTETDTRMEGQPARAWAAGPALRDSVGG